MEIKEKIKNMLDSKGKTWKDMAEVLECNYNLLHNKFKGDRIRYSEIEKMVNSLGYEITFRRKRT